MSLGSDRHAEYEKLMDATVNEWLNHEARRAILRGNIAKRMVKDLRQSFPDLDPYGKGLDFLMEEEMDVYLVVAFIKPTKNQEDDGAEPEIVLPITAVLADSKQNACAQAAQMIEKKVPASRLVVRAMPFCS